MASNDEIKARQAAQWDNVAESWSRRDAELEANSRPINEWLCEKAGLAPGLRVLDLASGSGQPALAIANLIGQDGWVAATDIAPRMVEVLADKAREAGLGNVEARVMDMESLDFPDESFDAVTCRWGFMYAPDPSRSLAEVKRVLKDGGRLTTAVWDTPDKNPWNSLIVQAMNQVQGPSPVDPDAPGPFRLATPGRVEALLMDAGFRSVELETVSFEQRFPRAEDWWDHQLDIGGPLRTRMSSLSEEDQARVKQIAISAAEAGNQGSYIRLGASCICAVATK
jgi:ubiquinone/menaquinone biosynthesis C-methylase UbiE